jgi:rod shape determining protein RodA
MNRGFSWDWLLLIVPVGLTIIGSAVIFSITHQTAQWGYFIQQITYLGIGLVLAIIFSLIDYRQLKAAAIPIYIIGLALLIVVVLFGSEIQGSSRWLSFGFFNLQPSEIYKIILTICLAAFFSSVPKVSWQQLLASFVITLIPIALVLFQPDLGTSLIFLAILLAMIIFSKIDRIYLFILGIGFIIAAPVMWFLVLADYQKQRIISFIYPQSDPFGSGYNVLQSTIAIGSGGMTGKGLGHGPQSQLNFLPSQHTDFIFASIGEELGFWGASLVLLLLAILLIKIINVYRNSNDDFGKYLVVGFFTIFIIQILVNIGMNLGIMPVTGIPLPFVSYGGSSLLTSYIMIGILASINGRKKKLKF